MRKASCATSSVYDEAARSATSAACLPSDVWISVKTRSLAVRAPTKLGCDPSAVSRTSRAAFMTLGPRAASARVAAFNADAKAFWRPNASAGATASRFRSASRAPLTSPASAQASSSTSRAAAWPPASPRRSSSPMIFSAASLSPRPSASRRTPRSTAGADSSTEEPRLPAPRRSAPRTASRARRSSRSTWYAMAATAHSASRVDRPRGAPSAMSSAQANAVAGVTTSPCKSRARRSQPSSLPVGASGAATARPSRHASSSPAAAFAWNRRAAWTSCKPRARRAPALSQPFAEPSSSRDSAISRAFGARHGVMHSAWTKDERAFVPRLWAGLLARARRR